MTTQHTPGPWMQSRRYIETDDHIVCEMFGEHLEERDANARLIAAAPDLLEACKAQHDAIDWLSARLIALDPSFFPSKSSIWPALQAGHAAIDKATGAVE